MAVVHSPEKMMTRQGLDSPTTPLVNWLIFCRGIHPMNMADSWTKNIYKYLRNSKIGAIMLVNPLS
jgi:hypothetical protein